MNCRNFALRIGLLSLLFLLVISCEKEDVVKLMEVSTTEAVSITAETATLKGEIIAVGDKGIIDHGFLYSNSESDDIKISLGKASETTYMQAELKGLINGVTYLYKVYAFDGEQYVYGEEKTFSTSEGIALIKTNSVISPSTKSTICNFSLELNEGTTLVECGVCWSTSPEPIITDNKLFVEKEIDDYSFTLTNLIQKTKYYARSYAITNSGTIYGNELSFETNDIEFSFFISGLNVEVIEILETSDGGFIIAMNSDDYSYFEGSFGGQDFWLFKYSGTGDLEWKKNYGSTEKDITYSFKEVKSGGYICAGKTKKNGDDESWIVKVDNEGSVEWEKIFSESLSDECRDIYKVAQGGYIAIGNSKFRENSYYEDIWVTKFDDYGNVEWRKTFGGTGDDVSTSIRQSIDGGYILSAYSTSSDGDFNLNNGEYDSWLLKLDTSGDLMWKNNFGGSGIDHCSYVFQTLDNNYVSVGKSGSSDGFFSQNENAWVAYVTKTDINGKSLWYQNFPGIVNDISCCKPTIDGGYILSYMKYMNDNDHGDFCIVKIDEQGAIVWEKTIGGSNEEYGSKICQTHNGNYLFAGRTFSYDGYLVGNPSGGSIWVAKFVGLD
ncbi:MAG: hypothetical protein ACERIH_04905 [Labilibaculum antarcticum]